MKNLLFSAKAPVQTNKIKVNNRTIFLDICPYKLVFLEAKRSQKKRSKLISDREILH